MISHNRVGQQGRIGNQLWQLAFVIGTAYKYKHVPSFIDWQYAKYFKGDFSQRPQANAIEIKERQFHFDATLTEQCWDGFSNFNFAGYFQSPQYWQGCEALIREAFEFQEDFRDGVKIKYANVYEKKTIAIHIRRSDYVNHQGYENLPPIYYLSALEKKFPDWREQNLLIFSDDQNYTRLHFGCFKNAYFATGNEVEDLCAMSLCSSHIIANSSFSWWGAFLSGSKEVVRPAKHFKGSMAHHDISSLYPPEWTLHEAERLNLTDVTFTIPVSWDSIDRQKNLELILSMIIRDFDTNIIVMEQQSNKFQWVSEYVDYYHFESPLFHRTKMLNQLAQLCTTDFFVNYDADVLFPPAAILQAVHLLRQGSDMVLPYSGRFVRMPRKDWYKRINESKDIGVTASHKFPAIRRGDMQSAGGAVFFNRQSFFKGGQENENLISFSPDDACRLHRFTTLGFDVQRVNGSCYHVEHQCLLNSGTRHPLIQANRDEWHKVAAMGKNELIEYVKTWEWVNQK